MYVDLFERRWMCSWVQLKLGKFFPLLFLFLSPDSIPA